MLSARRDIPLQCGRRLFLPRSLFLALSLSLSVGWASGDKQAATAQLAATAAHYPKYIFIYRYIWAIYILCI